MTKIVFIEDEPALQKALGEFLRAQGYEVVAALNGNDGLTMVRQGRPDLILLDLIVPGLPGLDILKNLKGDPETKSIPVIVLTNVESNESVEQAIELGAKAYLVKTNYALDEVLAKIKGVLGEA